MKESSLVQAETVHGNCWSYLQRCYWGEWKSYPILNWIIDDSWGVLFFWYVTLALSRLRFCSCGLAREHMRHLTGPLSQRVHSRISTNRSWSREYMIVISRFWRFKKSRALCERPFISVSWDSARQLLDLSCSQSLGGQTLNHILILLSLKKVYIGLEATNAR